MGLDQNSKSDKIQTKSLLGKLRIDMSNEEITPLSVVFASKDLEKEYRTTFVDHISDQRLTAILVITIYCGYGILDIATIKENLRAILTARLLVGGPILMALFGCLFIPKIYERYLEYIMAIGFAAMTFTILYMIAQISPREGPPYIIGILVVFIFGSCVNTVPFRLAAPVYIISTITYGYIVFTGAQFSSVDRISGLAFLSAIVLVSFITHYFQDVRSRLIWWRNRQRSEDTARIQELLLEATAADQSKISFISLLTHELRTPIHQIIGFAEVIRAQNNKENLNDIDPFVEEILSSGHGLLNRISKMLRYADATAGKIEYCQESLPVSELTEFSISQLEKFSEEKKITIETSNIKSIRISTDQQYTTYALTNIIENAIAASPENSTVVIDGSINTQGIFCLKIIDSGYGMSNENIKNALQPFSQIEAVRTRNIEGLGLGLTLSRKILIDQGATFEISSIVGEGTTVTINFPLSKEKKILNECAA